MIDSDSDHWPELKYWEERPGRKCLIVDDIGWGLSKRGSPSQFELADRTVGHISSHNSLTILIAHGQRLASHGAVVMGSA